MFDIFGNGTIAPPVNWQPDPSTRGTTDVLSTCLITLGLCLWSALHVNIPQHGKNSQQKWHKCVWLVLGLLAPEMVAYTAWGQLRAARKLDHKMKQLFGGAPKTSLRDRFWALLRAERNGRFKSTSGGDPEEGNCKEQLEEAQIGEVDLRQRKLNVARGDRRLGTASHESQPRVDDGPQGSHRSVIIDPKLNTSEIAVAGNQLQLVDEDRNYDRRASYGSETRHHQLNIDEVDMELREEYSAPSHPQPESEEPSAQADGRTSLKKRRHPWTMTHSFYAIMGGFAFDTSNAEPNFLPNHRSRLCISVRGLDYIAEKAPELIPGITEQHIKDKSKADSLAKFLVCLQALWFCVQCIARVTQRKAISLLELNTFAHAFCALLMYALWWHKPQNVEEPTLLQGQKAWEMCAFLCMNCKTASRVVSGEAHGGSAYGDPAYDPAAPPTMWIVWDPDAAGEPASASNRIPKPGTYSMFPEQTPYQRTPPGEGPAVMLKPGDLIYGFRCQQSKTDGVSGRSHRTLRIEPPRLKRLELYSKATKSFKIGEHCLPHEKAVCDFMPDWPLNLTLDESELLRVGSNMYGSDSLSSVLLGLVLAGVLYGGLHLLAWKVPFASKAERILWRFSGIFITSAGIGLTGLNGFHKACHDISSKLIGTVGITFTMLWFVFLSFLLSTICLGYLLARTFLVVECFLQLYRLPASAYETPEWSAYFPHIT